MRIAICIIYVHDDVYVSAYEYVNLYLDGYDSVFDDRYMYMKMIMIIVIVYVYIHEPENEN